MAVNDPMSNGTRSTLTNPSGATATTSQTGGTTTAGQTAQSAKDQVSQVASQAQQQAGHVLDQVKQQGKSQLTSQKANVAQSLQSVAQAADQFSQQLRQSNQAPVAGVVSQASGQVRRVSEYLNGNDISDIVDDVEDFARRQPLLFLGGALALGALAARFIKSSGQATRNSGGGSSNRPARGRSGPRMGGRMGAQSGYRTGYRPGYQGGAANGQFTANARTQSSDRPYQRDNGTTMGYYDPGSRGDDVREFQP